MNHQPSLFDPERYAIDTLDDEIRVDQLCLELLKIFHHDLVTVKKSDPVTAGALARGADYFLRNFMIDRQRRNIFDVSAQRVTGFAGNWYIVQNLEPDPAELADILGGVNAFYRFCAEQGLIPENLWRELTHPCENHEFYRQRIAAFFAIEGDGFVRWNAECPIV